MKEMTSPLFYFSLSLSLSLLRPPKSTMNGLCRHIADTDHRFLLLLRCHNCLNIGLITDTLCETTLLLQHCCCSCPDLGYFAAKKWETGEKKKKKCTLSRCCLSQCHYRLHVLACLPALLYRRRERRRSSLHMNCHFR